MSIDDDIEGARRIAQQAWDEGNILGWLVGSAIILAWRVARAIGWAR